MNSQHYLSRGLASGRPGECALLICCTSHLSFTFLESSYSVFGPFGHRANMW